MATVAIEEATFQYEQQTLENDCLKVDIFDPAKYGARFLELVQKYPETFTYVAFPVLHSVDELLTEVYNPIASSPADCLWAIIDKTRPAGANHDNLAGAFALTDVKKAEGTAEMGGILFPPFHRSHVASNTVGLILQYLLDPPSQGGLGLRRVAWHANANNKPSRGLAERMGFTLEGILRWQRTFAPTRDCQAGPGVALSAAALAARNGTKPEDEAPGRHTAVYSIVWDEWEEKRPHVVAQMGLRKK
ncbi:hypothetical protein HMPREF1624_05717 [Sporothrix schenckii ATCC 58251]|uniref:N-acetyltransferase domain-containing protein n=1 Tax=Sporothrix schenckii (strain ATCC 58251 / de Perez 2211183) TaxID=1391915 RepID=U7PRJ1_SPOS1|nr:hypothetical protein HMPREF1624_05717 [Sporothrix schenckii ATCC 58251]